MRNRAEYEKDINRALEERQLQQEEEVHST